MLMSHNMTKTHHFPSYDGADCNNGRCMDIETECTLPNDYGWQLKRKKRIDSRISINDNRIYYGKCFGILVRMSFFAPHMATSGVKCTSICVGHLLHYRVSSALYIITKLSQIFIKTTANL